MTILFDATAPVKTTARTFGRGILRSLPTYRAPYTSAEAALWAAESARLDAERAENRHFDAMAEAARGADLMSRGIRCF